ncbi:diaminopropionate ammonia-lyase [Rhodovarius crocodyli]|uniref:Diaminopropionate ammonia-lyase n=1 Tax=Rhodovarius crocodyli TaxID=1979269 RepID=A0A437MNC1_9PROT|nr:diaminopropionate ammonia-lyase [Rhodovarius crocodyli]RVT99143.1 diaminopropionate ammonia-lyase [Rhodovarius crocodyli]
MIGPYSYSLFLNPRHGTPGVVVLPDGGWRRAKAEITSWPGYAPTPLRELPASPFAALHYKDEGGRFGLGSFKALGGAYAVLRLVVSELAKQGRQVTGAELMSRRDAGDITVTCATDGNHGRSVAWGAQNIGARCVIYVHETVSQGRRDAIAAYGAEVREVPGNYDDAVREASRAAAEHGWHVVSDTSWPGYTEVPRDVMQGYRLMAEEALTALPAPPTHVFVQGGVGGVAAAVSVQLRSMGLDAKLVVVEPDEAACLLKSAKAGALSVVEGDLPTLMAGLACGEPSLLAWQELERAAYAFMAVPDDAAVEAMRVLAGLGVTAGESAVAGLVGAWLAARDGALGLGPDSHVLVFGTEGATDPELYAKLIGTASPV